MRTLAWILGIILALSLVSNIALIAERERDNTPKVEYIHKTDTIIHWKYDTDTVYMTNTKIKYKTKVINDTVWIKDEPITTRDSNEVYTLDINAVKLNWYNLSIHKTDTVYNTSYVFKYPEEEKRKLRLRYGFGIGVGYGFINRKPDIYAGFNIGLDF